MDNQMFCFQCEQTAGCSGCTGAVGVCGKNAETARLQDELTGALIGLAKAYGAPVMKSIRGCTERIFDVHLMIEEPVRYIEDFAEAGADLITVHAEACKHLDRTIQAIKEKGILAGVALNPATPLSAVEYILPEVDMVLVMTVNPGFGGQKLIPYTVEKVRDLKKMIDKRGLKTDIEVDGGINLENVAEVMDAGANIIVAGSAVFHGDVEENIEAFLSIINS